MKFLNFGSCNVDYAYSMHHIVTPGETQSSDKLAIFPGGKGLNQSIALARAGVKVYHAGCIGTDGDLLLEALQQDGVDVSCIRRVNEKNGHAIIQVTHQGENSSFVYAGSNAMITHDHVDAVLEQFGAGDVLVLQNEINALDYIVRRAHERGMFIALTPSPIRPDIFELDWSMLSCMILNEVEMRSISGCTDIDEGLNAMKQRYPALHLMLTLGQNGCIYQHGDVRLYHPIFETTVVDTTGAGDTFTGYFLAGLMAGKALKDVLAMASCASAIAVSRAGTSPAIPYRDEVVAALRSMKRCPSTLATERQRMRIETYIEENVADATLRGLSELLGYSTVYTGTLVRRLCGTTFGELLHRRRLSLAAELLKNDELSISGIIRRVGYENEQYFRDMFKKCYGVRPLEYRNQYKKQ